MSSENEFIDQVAIQNPCLFERSYSQQNCLPKHPDTNHVFQLSMAKAR